MNEVVKGTTVYYTQIMPTLGIYNLIELKVRTVNHEDRWFVATENRTKHAYLFNDKDINNIIYFNRDEALTYVKNAEKNKVKISNETYYEEY